MKTLTTLGSPGKRTQFSYSGSVSTGVTLHHSIESRIDAAFFRRALETFAGRRIKGGFSMTDPPDDGFGAWVQRDSRQHNSQTLTPRHGSFIATILVSEAGVESWLDGNSVWLRFPESRRN